MVAAGVRPLLLECSQALRPLITSHFWLVSPEASLAFGLDFFLLCLLVSGSGCGCCLLRLLTPLLVRILLALLLSSGALRARSTSRRFLVARRLIPLRLLLLLLLLCRLRKPFRHLWRQIPHQRFWVVRA